MTRGKSESLITPQSAVLLLLEGLLFTQNFMGGAGVSFKINGTAKVESVPLSKENRTFGIALNIYYNNDSTP